jgi:membrane dipeptidase
MQPTAITRRSFSAFAAAALVLRTAHTQPAPSQIPIADVHSHLGLIPGPGASLRQQMEASGTALVAWKIVDDAPWIRATPHGIVQVSQPAAGEVWAWFQRSAERMNAELAGWGMPRVLTPTDVDAAVGGKPHVVVASESANFLEGDVARLAQAHRLGLRHLQLVHYISSPIGDLQTSAPVHNGITPLARDVIAECKRLGILVDLAHCTPAFVEQALDVLDVPFVWSHGWIRRRGEARWNDWGYLARSLGPDLARKMAAKGAVFGLWTLRNRRDSSYPLYSINSYADEILRMADLLGPQAVAFGTDMSGVGPDPVVANYGELREVVNRLAQLKVPEPVLRDICIGNYARVLKRAMAA